MFSREESAIMKHKKLRSFVRATSVLLLIMTLLGVPTMALAEHDGDPHTQNVHPMGHDVALATLGGFGGAEPDIHTDIAFWGDLAFQGNWDGFRILDISAPGNPKLVSRTFCDGNQGDV